MRHNRHNLSAFTLIELVLVLVVMAIIASMVAERLIGFAHGRETANFADQLEGLARFARNEAVAKSAVYRLNIDAKTRVVWASQEDGPDGATVAVDANNSLANERVIPDGATVTFLLNVDENNTQATDVIHFYADGRAEPGSIKIVSGDTTITLNCPTGTDSYRVVKAGT